MPTGGGLNKVTFLSTYLSKDNKISPEYTYRTSQESYFHLSGSKRFVQGFTFCNRQWYHHLMTTATAQAYPNIAFTK